MSSEEEEPRHAGAFFASNHHRFHQSPAGEMYTGKPNFLFKIQYCEEIHDILSTSGQAQVSSGGLYDEVEATQSCCHRDPAGQCTPPRSSGNAVLRASENRTSELSRMSAEKGAEYWSCCG